MLYAVTDRTWLENPGAKELASQVEQALRGGVTMVQLREKELDEDELLREAFAVKEVCDRYGVPLIINDNIGIALEVDAAGVHLGQSDEDVARAREVLGPEKIIGVSARTVEQARQAQSRGADYLGTGAVFPTGTKRDAEVIGRDTLTEICRSVSIPVAAIGGITADNVRELAGSGISGIAVISAIFAQDDTRAAAALLRQLAEDII